MLPLLNLEYDDLSSEQYSLVIDSIKTFPPTGIVESANSNVKIYPNPANGRINFASSSLIKNIQVFDVIGNLVESKNGVNTSNYTLDISSLDKGIYKTKVTNNNNEVNYERIVIK